MIALDEHGLWIGVEGAVALLTWPQLIGAILFWTVCGVALIVAIAVTVSKQRKAIK